MIISRAVSALLILSLTTFTMAQTGGLTCSSDDGDYHYCRADTQNQVQLVRQISGSRCQQGYSWGFDPRGIWVDRGCRAQFSYGRATTQNNNNNTGAAIAGGILGALILGAAVAAASNNDDDSHRDHDRANYYNDGYRMGRQDADNGRPNFPGYWSERRPMKYSSDFDAGYVDGYNGFGRHPPR